MGTVKEYFCRSVKEKADPEQFTDYLEEQRKYDNDLVDFYGMISKEAREYFEDQVFPQLNLLFELEKDYTLDLAFSELNNVWKEILKD